MRDDLRVARRRRRKSSPKALSRKGWITAFGVVLVLALIESYPWVAGAVAGAVLFVAYWLWWVQPRRVARSEAERRDALRQAEREQHERDRRDLRERSLTLGGLLSLTSREFEVRVGEVLAEHRYSRIEHVGKAGDLGIDLFATDPTGQRFAVQCKRYAPDRLVRAPDVRLLYGDMTHAGVGGMFVTTSGFTADAAAYAESHGIVLIDGAGLVKLIGPILASASSDAERDFGRDP
jgi:restriction system protein